MQTLESILLEILGELKTSNSLMQAALAGDKPKKPKKDAPAAQETPAEPETKAPEALVELIKESEVLAPESESSSTAVTVVTETMVAEDPEAPISSERGTALRNHFRDIQEATMPADLAAMKGRFEELKKKYAIAKLPEVKNKDYAAFERDLLAISEA